MSKQGSSKGKPAGHPGGHATRPARAARTDAGKKAGHSGGIKIKGGIKPPSGD